MVSDLYGLNLNSLNELRNQSQKHLFCLTKVIKLNSEQWRRRLESHGITVIHFVLQKWSILAGAGVAQFLHDTDTDTDTDTG